MCLTLALLGCDKREPKPTEDEALQRAKRLACPKLEHFTLLAALRSRDGG